jgi:MFS family permease
MSPRSARLVARFGAKAVATTGMIVSGLAIAMYALLSTNSPIVILTVAFLIQGAAIGVTMPAATASVMEVLPRERAGAGSALTNTARQVAVALGVAVLGSILAESYRSHMAPELAHLPAAAASTAGQSVSATQAVADQLGAAGRFLLEPANVAFVDAMRITTIIAAVVSILGGLVVLRWMPGRPRLTMDSVEEEVAAEIAAAEAAEAAEQELAER